MKKRIEVLFDKTVNQRVNIKHNMEGFLENGRMKSLKDSARIVENLNDAIQILGELLDDIDEFKKNLANHDVNNEIAKSTMIMCFRSSAEKASSIDDRVLSANCVRTIFDSFEEFMQSH